MDQRTFEPKTPQEELDMILFDKGDFQSIKEYLEPLIADALDEKKLGFDEETKNRLHGQIAADIPVALGTFFTDKEAKDKNMSFSIYFTQYITERINAEPKKEGLWGKIKSVLHKS
jgi:hypothetical protein